MVAQKVAVGVYKGVTTSELDELAAETSASMTATHPDYALVRHRYITSKSWLHAALHKIEEQNPCHAHIKRLKQKCLWCGA